METSVIDLTRGRKESLVPMGLQVVVRITVFLVNDIDKKGETEK